MLILPKWKKNHCRKKMQIKMQKSSDFFHIFKKIFLILRKTRSKFGVLFQIIYREKRLGIKPPFWEKKFVSIKILLQNPFFTEDNSFRRCRCYKKRLWFDTYESYKKIFYNLILSLIKCAEEILRNKTKKFKYII